MREYMREGRDIVKMRWWCMRKREQGWSGNEIAAHLQVPRRTIYECRVQNLIIGELEKLGLEINGEKTILVRGGTGSTF
jgi:hypothetical protein